MRASEPKVTSMSPDLPGLLYDPDDGEEHSKELLSELDEEPDASSGFTVKRKWDVKRSYVLYLLLFVGAIGIVTTTVWSWTHHSRRWVACGQSPAEARAAGCHFEPMLRAWVPDACYFPEPGEEYSPFDDRTWYSDIRLTQAIVGEELEKLKSGELEWAYTHEFHDEHCIYVWRKFIMAAERRLTLIDGKTANFQHQSHCSARTAETMRSIANGTWDIAHSRSYSPLKYIRCFEFSWP
ncbi:hypothetical protein B7463_g2514, partial [Scytalidium lignicola]